MLIHDFKFDRASSEAFLAFRRELHRDDVGLTHGGAELAAFLPEFAFHRRPGNDHRNFVARFDGRIVGHVSASVSAERRDRDGTPVGALGYFECVDDPSLPGALLGAAIGWLRDAHAIKRVWGPLNFDIWHGYRFMTSGFDEAPFLGEPRNKTYYPRAFERFGFFVRHEWSTIEIVGREELAALAAVSQHRHRDALAAGYSFRALDADCADDRRSLYDLEIAAFRQFLCYTPLPQSVFEAQFSAYTNRLSPRFFHLGFDPRGEAVAFAVAFPHQLGGLPVSSREAGAPSDPSGRAVLYMVGVAPAEAVAQRGLGRAILHFTLRRLLEAGVDRLIVALITDETVRKSVFGDGTGQSRRTYALYELNN